jgi:hypothetical protein
MNLLLFFGDNPIQTLCIPLNFAGPSATLLWNLSSPSLEEHSDLLIGSTPYVPKIRLTHWLVDSLFLTL